MTRGWRTYPDNPHPGIADIGHFGGIIRNNVVVRALSEFDTGIGLEQSRGTKVCNNIVRNLTQRDGATGTSASNLETTSTALFVDANAKPLRRAPRRRSTEGSRPRKGATTSTARLTTRALPTSAPTSSERHRNAINDCDRPY
jgi:hypothetical protein